MGDSGNNHGDDVRRKRLDELFADEPHLSPTMKARRLHEKLNGFDAQTDLPARAFVPDTRPIPAQNTLLQPLSWQTCEAYFHGRYEASLMDEETARRLHEWGRGTLREWLRRLPPDER